MSLTQQREYYLSRRSGILTAFDSLRPFLEKALQVCGGVADAEGLVSAVRTDLNDAIPMTPYIGGSANRLTENLIGVLWTLFLYRR